MKDIITNRLDMAAACIAVADKPENLAITNTVPPLDFVADYAAMKAEHASIFAAASMSEAATTGFTDTKADAEEILEERAYIMARALCVHFAKTGNLTDRARVDLTKTSFARLRDAALKTTCELIYNLAVTASGEPGAAGRGITAPRITALEGALSDFSDKIAAPRGQIATRSAQKREVEMRVAGLMEMLSGLDDLILLYGDTEAGRAFIAAWQAARTIVDAGHGPAPTPPTPPTP